MATILFYPYYVPNLCGLSDVSEETLHYINMALIGVAVFLVIGMICWLLLHCRSNSKTLIVFGKVGKYKDNNGKVITNTNISRCGVFVFPIIQDYKEISVKEMKKNGIGKYANDDFWKEFCSN